MKNAWVNQFRGDVLECRHQVNICVVDGSGIVHAWGDPDAMTFFRSTSKPIQALPVIAREIRQKYALSERETAIISASHRGDAEHIETLESMLAKTGLQEDGFIMKPTYPLLESSRFALLRAQMPPRKLYHNCFGKHIGLQLLARELGQPVGGYWKAEGPVFEEIVRVVCKVSEYPASKLRLGTDGCGVPVFAVPLQHIARAYLNLACPERIHDDALARAAAENAAYLHAYPSITSCKGAVSALLNADDNLLCKDGAQAVYGLALKREGLGIAWHVLDGNEAVSAHVAVKLLEILEYRNRGAVDVLRGAFASDVYNDNGTVVGKITVDLPI